MEDTSQLEFNINVKVEEIEEEINTEETNESLNNVTNKQYNKQIFTQVISTDDSDDENISENSNSTEPICNQEDNLNETAASSSAFSLEICNSLESDDEKKFFVIHKNFIYTLTRKTILKGIEEQTKSLKSKSDLLLNKFTRSQHPEIYTHAKTVHEYLLENAIELWRNWYERNTKLRNTPLSYKCYVCNNGWWRLNPFKQHIIIHKHPQFLISFEGVGNEGNIVASINYPKLNNPITIDGNCWKCNKPYKSHALTALSKYTCESCWMDFKTCIELAQHESTCESNINEYGLLCNLCPMYCVNKDTLYRHKVLYHTPKSDDPSVIMTKVCSLCEEKYYFVSYHDCPKRPKLFKCDFCWNKYVSKPLQELHMSMNKGFSKCPDCSRSFRNCFLIEHLIEHSSNYSVIQYCNKCNYNVLYIDKSRFARHMVKHETDIRKKRYTVKMLLPIKCYQGIVYDSAIPLDISGSHLLGYLDNVGYTNYTLPKLLALIYKIHIQNARNKKKTKEKKKLEIQNQPKNLEMSDLNKKINKKAMPDSILNNSKDDIESDIAFQEQLDAEIKKDVEIDNEISELFKTSSIYKKFLDKEANDPIEDNDVCIIEKKEEVFVISDSDSEISEIIIDSICEDVPDINIINRSNSNMLDETNINTTVKIECNNEIEIQDTNESVREIKKEDNTIENISNDIKKEISNEIKEEIVMKENSVVDVLNNVEKLDLKIENGILDDDHLDNGEYEMEISDYSITMEQTDFTYCCKKCRYRGSYEDFIAHLLICRKYMKCTYCKKTFSDIKTYLKHFPEHKLKYLSCPQCTKKFSILNNLKKHILTHVHELYFTIPEDSEKYIDNNNFLCYVCDDVVEIDNFFIHWESHLELSEIAVDEVSEDISELKSMMTPEMVTRALVILSDTGRDHKNKKCIVCSKVNVRKNDSKRHLTEHLLHEAKVKMIAEGGQLRCPMCAKEIEELSAWRQHVREHAHIKIYRCTLCPKKFSDSSNFSKHRKVHNQHKYICDLCGGKFCAKTSIIRHLKNHEPMTSMKCPTCSKILPSEHRLKRHIQVRHINFLFACHVCNRKLNTCKEKWDHLWNKHKIRKYVADCPLCSKQYRRLIDVKNHMRFMHGIDKTEGSYNTTYYEVKNKKKIKREANKPVSETLSKDIS